MFIGHYTQALHCAKFLICLNSFNFYNKFEFDVKNMRLGGVK